MSLLRTVASMLVAVLLSSFLIATAQADPLEGRRLLYRTHVDAAHIAWENNGLRIKVVDGATPVDADSVIVRLGPDATNGYETSRIKIPQDPSFAFLGNAGEIIWNAPQQLYSGHTPVWAGLGSGKFPAEIEDSILPETLHLSLVGKHGPGDFAVYTVVDGKARPAIVSADPKHHNFYTSPGSHGHFNWGFTAPGRYDIQWQAHVTTRAGETLTSPVTTVTWLVGSDEEVGLPSGTTKGGSIASPAETFPELPPANSGEKALENDTIGWPCTPIDGTKPYSIKAAWKDTEAPQVASPQFNVVDSDGEAPADTPLIYIPTQNAQTVPQQLQDLLGPTAFTNAASIPFDTTAVDYSPLFEVLTFAESVHGPGKVAITSGNTVLARSDNLERWKHRSLQPASEPLQFWFSEPGYYTVDLTTMMRRKRNASGEMTQNYEWLNLRFAVGESTMKASCTQSWKPSTGTSTPEPLQPLDPSTPETIPQPEPVVENTTLETFDRGHVELFYVHRKDGQLGLSLREDITGNRKVRAPESVTLRVTQRALRTDVPSSFPGSPRAWVLPQENSPSIIWPGWDTSEAKTPVHFEVSQVEGPGEIHVLTVEGFEGRPKSLLTSGGTALPGTIVEDTPSHRHPLWIFTAPGRYTMKVQAKATIDGAELTSPVRSYTWIVSDDTAANPPAATPPTTEKPSVTQPDSSATDSAQIPSSEDITLDKGHVDIFFATARDQKLQLALREDITGQHVVRQPGNVKLKVSGSAYSDIPAGYPGAPKAWVLPMVQDPDRLWLGWDTTEVAAATDIVISRVEGPGEVHLFSEKPFGGLSPLLRNNATALPGTIEQKIPSHAHANWVFTAPGTYTLTAHAESTISGQRLSSPEQKYTFIVDQEKTPQTPASPLDEVLKPNMPSALAQPPAAAKEPGSDAQPEATPDTSSPRGSGENSSRRSPLAPAEEPCIPVESAAGTEEGTSATAQVAREGHFDLGAQIASNQLQAAIKDDRTTPGKWGNPENFIFTLGDEARMKAPESLGFMAETGSDVWLITTAQQPGVPWIGQNTMHDSIVADTTGELTWTLDKVDGPGHFALFASGTFGGGVGKRLVDNTADGPKSMTLPANTHSHPNWAFSKPGQYRVHLKVSAKSKDGKELSASTTLHFAVGVDPQADKAPSKDKASSSEKASSQKQNTGRTPSGKPCTVDKNRPGFPRTGWEGMEQSPTSATATIAVALLALLLRGAHRRFRMPAKR